MPVLPCPTKFNECSPCADDTPIRNWTSEDPDGQVFIGIFNQGPTAGTFFAPGCVALCESAVSQQAADLCAARQAFECSMDNAPAKRNFAPSNRKFGNSQQSCESVCGDDPTGVTSVVAPGTVVSGTQADADARAHALACKEADNKAVCFVTASPLDPVCVNTGMSVVFEASGGDGEYVFALDSGALPDGTELNPQGNLFGTPTVTDSFTFGLSVTDGTGTSVVKAFTIDVVELPTSSLTDALVDIVYGPITIPTTGFIAPMTWAVQGGTFPPGMTLNATTGQITGAPTSAGTFNFTLRLIGTTASGKQAQCDTDYTLIVRPCLWQISDYADSPFIPAAGDASTDPAWSGYVNYISVPQAGLIAEVDVMRDNLNGFVNPHVSIAGKRVHFITLVGPIYGTFTPPGPGVLGPPPPASPDTWYHFSCSVKVGAAESIVWEGYKVNGDVSTRAGTYLKFQGSDGRASIVIAAC